MTALTPVERVAALLVGANYRRLTLPFEIATLRFEVSAAFVGTGQAADLVIVCDSATIPDERLARLVEGLSRALDVVGSRRPLTAVLVGARPSTPVLADVARFCRVLPIGAASSEQSDQPIKDWLSALLPLQIPATTALLENPLAALETIAGQDGTASSLLQAARAGSNAVTKEFLRQIDEALSSVPGDERP